MDIALIEIIVPTSLPFTIVREPSFRNFVSVLQPSATVMSYQSLIKKMDAQMIEMKENLIQIFAMIEVLCLTADGWTCAKRSFIGVTVHWLDGYERKSAVLACKRIIGSHTYDNLSKHLEEVIAEYGLQSKSTHAGETVKKFCGEFFVTPVPTR